jgi:hypothetical protein
MTEVRAELLVGRRVRDRDGRNAGRIEEIHAERNGGEWRVVEYLLGAGALLDRLSMAIAGRRRGHGHRARWDQLDVRDPRHPRLRCRREELGPL